MTSSRERSRLPRLHLITSDQLLRSSSFGEIAAGLLGVGGDRIALHLRGQSMSGREMWDLAANVKKAVERFGSWLFINDRIDVAIACGAHGVQLGEESFQVREARRIVPASMLIGVSVHGPYRSEAAVNAGADFLVAGTIFESASHPEKSCAGAALVSGIAAFGAPVIAIGGVTVERVSEVRERGAHGVAVISGIWNADDPVGQLERYLKELED